MPARKRTRVVVDVKVLVSALISADRSFLQELFNKQRYHQREAWQDPDPETCSIQEGVLVAPLSGG